MLATQLDTVKIRGLTTNVSVEEQLLNPMQEFQKNLSDQPALIDITMNRSSVGIR